MTRICKSKINLKNKRNILGEFYGKFFWVSK
jgi:hypothetical protein